MRRRSSGSGRGSMIVGRGVVTSPWVMDSVSSSPDFRIDARASRTSSSSASASAAAA
jgi:hypothetical protein